MGIIIEVYGYLFFCDELYQVKINIIFISKIKETKPMILRRYM